MSEVPFLRDARIIPQNKGFGASGLSKTLVFPHFPAPRMVNTDKLGRNRLKNKRNQGGGTHVVANRIGSVWRRELVRVRAMTGDSVGQPDAVCLSDRVCAGMIELDQARSTIEPVAL